MAARNRVTPMGEVVAAPGRGMWAGNRGCLHRGREIVRHHVGTRWIICATEFRGRWSAQWVPGRFTWLFFPDEAVALAAGHRPCAQCRWDAFNAYREAAFGRRLKVPVMDAQLQEERWAGGDRRLHRAAWAGLPTGAFVLHEGRPSLVLDDGILPWAFDGYRAPASRPRGGQATLITPPSSVRAIDAGYPVQHSSP